MQQGEPAPKRQRIEVTKMPFKYGKADFGTLRQKGTFYVDNTRFIRTLDDQRLFGDLDIGKDPVPGARQYYVLRWDFSVDVSEPEIILSDKFSWEDLEDTNVKLSENVFRLLAYNPLSDSAVANLKTGPIVLKSKLVSILRMEDLQTVESQSDIFLLSLMYYHGMVTFCEGPDPGSLRIPNRLAEFQFLDQLGKSLRPSETPWICARNIGSDG